MLTDVEGRRIFDFHGNSVHQLGHGHPKVVAAIKAANGDPAVLSAPLRQRDGDRARASPGRNFARRARQGSVCAERRGGGRHGAETRALRDRASQDAVAVGLVPRRQSRHDRRRRRGLVSARARADGAGRRTPAAARSGAPLLRRRPAVRALRRLYRLCARGPGRRRRADRRTDALDDGRSAAAGLLAAGARPPAPATARC